jgi:hypothetical protein
MPLPRAHRRRPPTPAPTRSEHDPTHTRAGP